MLRVEEDIDHINRLHEGIPTAMYCHKSVNTKETG